MPLTTEQRRESMAKARAARKPKVDWESKAVPTDKPDDLADLRLKVEILWGEHEAKVAAERSRYIPYQCVECRATTTALHPSQRGGIPVECPNRYTKHGGSLTPMDYTP